MQLMEDNMPGLCIREEEREEQRVRWLCTDCDDPRGILRPDGRCPICGGARIIKLNQQKSQCS